MKIKFLKFTVLLFVLTGSFYSCKNKEKEELAEHYTDPSTFFGKLKYAKLAITPIEELPEWLACKILEMESIDIPMSMLKIVFYRGEWKSQTVYYIYNFYWSCMFCETYYENGEKIIWDPPTMSNDFCAASTNWELIYEIGKRDLGF